MIRQMGRVRGWRPTHSVDREERFDWGKESAEDINREERIEAHARRVEVEAPLYAADDLTKDDLMEPFSCMHCGRKHRRGGNNFCSYCTQRAKR